jgi:hypothetical protein
VNSTPKVEDAGHADTIGNLRALRYPFPPARVGVLPKPTKKDNPKSTCPECGKYHGLPAVHLDYVGHGAVTERLLEVDPEWTWEPLAFTEEGLPHIVWLDDDTGVLWIRLTVLGVTRLGVGTAAGFDVEKQLIGDAIRNAAMRFGVALDLWIKGDADEGQDEGKTATRRRAPKPDPAPARLSDWTISAKLDLLRTVNQSKELARDLWASAATNYGLGVDDDAPDEETAVAIYMEAKRLLLESGKVRREEYPPPVSPFDGSTEPFEMPWDPRDEEGEAGQNG